jgi:hypothetical protein
MATRDGGVLGGLQRRKEEGGEVAGGAREREESGKLGFLAEG